VRVTLDQTPDGYDCFGTGERTFGAISKIRHRPPVIIQAMNTVPGGFTGHPTE
jgi:hypothetical protein